MSPSDTHSFSARLPEDLYRQLEAEAARLGVSVNTLMVEAAEQKLAQKRITQDPKDMTG